MLSTCLYVYADKFTAYVQNVCLPNARMHWNVSLRTGPTFSETVRHGVRRSFKTWLHRVVFL